MNKGHDFSKEELANIILAVQLLSNDVRERIECWEKDKRNKLIDISEKRINSFLLDDQKLLANLELAEHKLCKMLHESGR